MDYTILYIIGIGLISLGLGIGSSYLMKKYKVNKNDIITDIDLTKGLLLFIKITLEDMSFGDKNTIDKATDIISQSLDYIKGIQNVEDKRDKVKLATTFAVNLCTKSDIELSKNRLYIINTIIMMSYNIYFALEEKNIKQEIK